eukprot:gene18674-23587_t
MRAVAVVAAAAAAAGDRAGFAAFKRQYRREYASAEEEERRFAVFEDNLRVAALRDAAGHASHGVTKFSDWTPAEFRAMLGYRPGPSDSAAELAPTRVDGLPAKIDWSKKGMTSPVKDQG